MLYLLIAVLILILLSFLLKLSEDYNLWVLCKRVKVEDKNVKLEDKVCLIKGKTRFGNTFDMIKLSQESLFAFFRNNCRKTNGKSYLMYYPGAPLYNIVTAEDAQNLFQSSTLINKSFTYDLTKPFLGDGLLLSRDQKWHFRRKILTTAFHFKVLQSFIEIFKEESLNFLKRLEGLTAQQVDIAEVISEFTLNNICETAMGVKLSTMPGGNEYRKALHLVEEIILERLCNPLLYPNSLFYLFGKYKLQEKYLRIIHGFSNQIIQRRRVEFSNGKLETNVETLNDDGHLGKKKRYAMLDTLLYEESLGNIDHQGICEEVNTFMFAGYDTTSAALTFIILNLSLHQEVQEKCRRELEKIDDFNTLTMSDFNNLPYLECVIKESLRLYPSAPFAARECENEIKLNGFIFPKNTQLYLHIFDILRDPNHFENPNDFKPERFSTDQQTSDKRHPFAYVPFSAGSRNCIGQKFAMLEMKTILVGLLQNFRILPVTKLDEIVLSIGFVLKTKNKIYVKFEKL